MAVNRQKSLLSLAVLLVVLCSTAMYLSLNTNMYKYLPQYDCERDKTIPVISTPKPEPLLEAAQVRRQIGRDVRYTWQFLRYHLKNLNSGNVNVSALLEDLGHYFRVTSQDLAHLAEVNGFQEWQRKEAADLSALVQHRLYVLQNPRDCATAKKIYCEFSIPVSSNTIYGSLKKSLELEVTSTFHDAELHFIKIYDNRAEV
ncbi:uncharacterized protein LOC122254181 [Penaeus japonicus]|uniref:uncharacterized protein LOC122254181 n=1 Tax=Penaeus japonicus TaxID=27405 RepID=UPI001C712770|nr:uncharacterized protein LOC122254181 [Penaeus japonicus]